MYAPVRYSGVRLTNAQRNNGKIAEVLMNRERIRPLSPEELETYERDGVVLLRGLFDDPWIERLQKATDEVLANPTKAMIDVTEKQGGMGRFTIDTLVWKHHEDFKSFVFASPAAQIARQLMGAKKKVNLLMDPSCSSRSPARQTRHPGITTTLSGRPRAGKSARFGWHSMRSRLKPAAPSSSVALTSGSACSRRSRPIITRPS